MHHLIARSPERVRAALRLVLLAALLCAPLQAFAADDRPFTVDDALRMEQFGPGEFAPDGHGFVFVQVPPFETLPDFSLLFGNGPTFGTLRWTSLAPGAAAAPLLPADPKALRALMGFSPDGRFVAYLEAKEGELHLGVVDVRSRRTQLSDALPEQTLVHNLAPAWIAPGRLLFAARAAGSIRPFAPYLRRATGERLSSEWDKAWSGREVSASVYRSRRDGGSNPPIPGRLVEFNVETGETLEWASGLFSDLRLSPDGKYIAAVEQFEKSQMPADSLGNNGWLYGRGRMVLFDVATRARIDASPDLEAFPGTAEWSADGRKLGFFAWKFDGESVAEGLFRVFSVGRRSLSTLPHTGLDLVNEREYGPPAKPCRFVWIGERIAVAARPNAAGDSRPKFSPKGVSGRDLNPESTRFDWYLLAEKGAPKNLTARFKNVSAWPVSSNATGADLILDEEVQRLEASGRASRLFPDVAVEGPPGLKEHFYNGLRTAYASHVVIAGKAPGTLNTFDLERKTVVRIELKEGDPQLVAVDSTNGRVAYKQVHLRGTDLEIGLPSGERRNLAQINTHLADVAIPSNRPITYPGADGKPITSCLTLPPGAEPGKRYPTMVYVYPSSRPGCREHPDMQGFSYENRIPIVAKGYALLNVAAPMVATREGGPLDGIVAATDRAIDAAIQDGNVDADRLALIGASGAGFSGVWIAGHSTRFKALISINGIANIQSHYFSVGLQNLFYDAVHPWYGDASRYESLDQFGFGFMPWDDAAYYWKISPIAYAKQMNIPVLLVCTDMDVSGFSGQYDEMFVALNRLRKEVDYVKYWGEGHGPVSPANVRDLTARTVAWLDKYLGTK